MASSNSPESPSKKRKQSITASAHLRRDQPLFASRRPLLTLQQPPDFLTDSLNTSHIPTPSPTKSLTHPDLAAKPRQLRQRKTLGAAFQKAGSRDENGGPAKSASLPLGGYRHQARKAGPQQTPERGTPRSVPKTHSPARVRTPTPPRGRLISQTSPAESDPSPGRGYGEAYQRIDEEQSLAHDDSIDNPDLDELDHSFDNISQNLDLPVSQDIHHSNPSSPLRALRNAPSPLNEMSEVNGDGNTENDFDRESEVGHMDVEDSTCLSLDSNNSQYQKDLQRLHNTLKSKPKAFGKARMGEGGLLTLENLTRRNGSNESLRSSRSIGSFSLASSEPSANIPKAWGRKARPGNDWLSRINDRKKKPDSASLDQRHSDQGGATRDQDRSNRDEIDAWVAAAADVPLPSSERKSTPERFSHSSPQGLIQQHAHGGTRNSWGVDDDFTGRSLQVSDSPPMLIGKGDWGSDTNREIKILERQAVTTSRLGPLRERLSGTDLQTKASGPALSERHRSPTPLAEEPLELRRVSSDPSSHSKRASGEEKSIDWLLDGAGEPVPDTPVVIYKGKAYNVDGTPPGLSGDQRENARPLHQRKDSHDLLKRLSRAASDSPSPDKEQWIPQSQPAKVVPGQGKTPQMSKPAKHLKTPRVMGAWVDQTVGETPQVTETVKNVITPHVMGGWVGTPLPAGGRQQPDRAFNLSKIEEQQSPEPKSAAAGLVRELNPHTKPSPRHLKSQEPLPYTGPPLPKSALQNIISQAKSTPSLPIIANVNNEEDATFKLGDSTIQSLEDLVVHGPEASVQLQTPPSEKSSLSSDASPETGPRDTSGLGNRIDPSQTYLLSRLTNLAPSIRDSKKQIAALERQLSHPSPHSTITAPSIEGQACVEGGTLHDFLLPCQKCGRSIHYQAPEPLPGFLTLRDSFTSLPTSLNDYLPQLYLLGRTTFTSTRTGHADGQGTEVTEGTEKRTVFTHLHLTLPLPRLWSLHPSPTASNPQLRRPRLTWLGTAVLIWTIWSIAEYWARDRYCHKAFAYSMTGYGVDIHAPDPPFVIFKVAWSKWGLREGLWPVAAVWRILVRCVASFVGYIVGFVFGDERGGGQGEGWKSEIPPSPRGVDVSMMDDEIMR